MGAGSDRDEILHMKRSDRMAIWRAWARLVGGFALVAAASAGLAGCGGSSSSAADSPPASDAVISGTVTFDLVPVVAGLGLDYASTRASPARGVTVELVSAQDAVLASTATDAAGRYSLGVAPNTDVRVRVRARMQRTGAPGWDVEVLDNVNDDAPYALDGTVASSGANGGTRDLHAASGWDGTGYGQPRSAAPFAILDAVYDAMQFVAAANPAANFPPLKVHWSPDNVPSFGAEGTPDPATGELGTSYFAPDEGIYLLGREGLDTEEYDRHVIVHEWGHYLEGAFSRSDSIGGPHSRGDQLDLRVAFSEGWGNALSAMVTGDAVYVDANGAGQRQSYSFDIEAPLPRSPNPRPGWYSEESVQEIVYDVFDDDDTRDEGRDGIALGFVPIYDVLTGPHRDARALTSIFTFVDGLKGLRPGDADSIDALVATHAIGRVADGYGTGEINVGEPTSSDFERADLAPIYTPLALGARATVCSLDAFSGSVTGSTNKLGSRRFLRFEVTEPRLYQIAATTVEMPPGATADPDMVLHRGGTTEVFENEADATVCRTDNPRGCTEVATASLEADDYVLEVYEWTNTNAHDDDQPPIGRTCFEVEVRPI